MSVFCHIVIFINLFASIVYMAYALCTLPKKVAGIVVPENKVGIEAEKYRLNKFSWEMAKILLFSIAFSFISSITCLADGLTDEKYMSVTALVICVGGFAYMMFLNIYFSVIAQKYRIIKNVSIYGEPIYHNKFLNTGVTQCAMLTGFIYAITFGTTIYTFILMLV